METFEEFQKRIDDQMGSTPPPTIEQERRELMAILPALTEAGDLMTLLEARRRLRELARAAAAERAGLNGGVARNRFTQGQTESRENY